MIEVKIVAEAQYDVVKSARQFLINRTSQSDVNKVLVKYLEHQHRETAENQGMVGMRLLCSIEWNFSLTACGKTNKPSQLLHEYF